MYSVYFQRFSWVFFLLATMASACTFYQKQRDEDRVKAAYSHKEDILKAKLFDKKIDFNRVNIVFISYKDEKILEIHLKNKDEDHFGEMLSYPVCAAAGTVGPKRQQGDYQVPEGFYYIRHFNPRSSYHLSLGINYPNESDLRLTTAERPGGDIYIHGDCVSIGCLAMTDDQIEEIYLLALQARHAGQDSIPVYIFPFRMTAENMARYQAEYEENIALIAFWKNLQNGYNLFYEKSKILDYSISSDGYYVFE